MSLAGPDGKPIQKIPFIKWGEYEFPIRILNPETLFKNPPQQVIQGILIQQGDLNNLFWLGMVNLAKDMYSRQPEGSRCFEELVQALGLQLVDMNDKKILVEEELKKPT